MTTTDMGLPPEHLSTEDSVAAVIGRLRSLGDKVTMHNSVHAYITRGDGSIEDLGTTENLRTTVGTDWLASLMGGKAGLGDQTATASSATSITKSGASWTTDQFKGMRVIADNGTNAPVYGNISSNSGTVITVDQWWNGDDSTGSTPGSTTHFYVAPGAAPARFIGLTTDASAANAADTTLASEITTNGLGRALGAYAHTDGQSTFTITKTFTATGTHTAVHRAGLFTGLSSGILCFETVLNADATLVNTDTLTITWTVTLS